MAVLALPSDIKTTGINQDSLVTFLTNVVTVINELVDDHATNKVSIDELITLTTELRADHATFKTAVDAIETLVEELHDDHATFKTAVDNHTTSLANFKTIYDAHTHTADGNASRTSLPDTGSPTGSPSAASAFTNTVGTAPATLTAAKPASGPATLTAAKPASAPATITAGNATASAATLTNSTDLTLLKG